MRKPSTLIILLVAFTLLQSCVNTQTNTLIKNAESDFIILIPEDADSTLTYAATELQKYIQKISNVTLPIEATQKEHNAKFIKLGSTYLDESFNVNNLQRDGFIVEMDQNGILIAGANSRSTLYGVYDFLEDDLGCMLLNKDVLYIPEEGDISYDSQSRVEIPVFTFRELHFLHPLTSPYYRQWHKLNKKSDPEEAWGHLWVHTFYRLIPSETYFDEHPEYFSEMGGKRIPGGQLCLTNEDVFHVLLKNLKIKIDEYPEARFWSVSQNDNFLSCQCDECIEMDEKLGGPSGTMIHFVNRIADSLPDLTISTLAYQYTRSAPKNIIPRDNVNIMLCTIECNRSLPIAEDPGSQSFVKDIQDWGKITDNILIWDYVVQFRSLVSPFPNFHVLKPNLNFFADNNAFMMFQQGSGRNVAEFYNLRAYIIAKLLWNPKADVQKITENFVKAYYGEAAPFILTYIDRLHETLSQFGKGLGIYGYPHQALNSYLSPELIKEYSLLFDKAEKAVADDYEILERVQVCRLPLEYAILEISMRNYNDDLTYFHYENNKWRKNEAMRERLKRFSETAKKAGIERLHEHGKSPESYYEAMIDYVDNSMQENYALFTDVSLKTTHSEKYPVGGGEALTDGLKGVLDFHFNWLGFEGEHMEAIIDLGSQKEVSYVSCAFLQEYKSWIFLPEKIIISGSEDGEHFTELGILTNEIPDKKGDIFKELFELNVEESKARYIKIEARSKLKCPDWHIGAGNPCWIFCDEVIVL